MEKHWLIIRKASVYLSAHPKILYVWAAKGLLPTSKIAGSLKVDKKKLDAKLEASEKISLESKVEDWGL